MNRRFKRILVAGLLLAGLGGGGYVVAQLAGAQQSGSPGILITSNRTQLSLCVDGAGGYVVSAEEVQAVRQALEDGLAKVPNLPSQYQERQVSAGCPPSTVLRGTPISYNERHTSFPPSAVMLPSRDAASQHLAFVYFAPPELYASSFPGEPYATMSEEFVCEGDLCFSVTRGLYLPASAPSDVLAEGLLYVLNVLPRTPVPEPTMDWAACERGTPPHPEFTCERYEDWKRDQEQQQSAP